MIYATHNSLSFAKPKWFMYPLIGFAKCQCLSIQEQYNLGCRVFDFRVRFTKKGKVIAAHGLIEYKIDVYEQLRWLNSKLDAKVILLLEDKLDVFGPKKVQREHYFKQFCKEVQSRFRNITYSGGERKSDWAHVYKFKNKRPSTNCCYEVIRKLKELPIPKYHVKRKVYTPKDNAINEFDFLGYRKHKSKIWN